MSCAAAGATLQAQPRGVACKRIDSLLFLPVGALPAQRTSSFPWALGVDTVAVATTTLCRKCADADGLGYSRKEGGQGCNTNHSFALTDASGVSRQSVAAVLFLHRWIPKAEARMP